MKKYLNIEPINAETLLEIDTRVETCEELNNQEIFDLAKRKKTEEDKVETLANEENVSNKDALLSVEKLFKFYEQKEYFNEEDFNDLNKIKKKVEKIIENNLTQKTIF